MTTQEKDHVLIQVIKYGLKNDRFTLIELMKKLELTSENFEYVKKLTVDALERANENHVMYQIEPRTNPLIANSTSYSVDHSLQVLLPTAIKFYTEYEEIRMARESALEAKRVATKANRVAMWAIIISAGVGIAQILISVFVDTPINK